MYKNIILSFFLLFLTFNGFTQVDKALHQITVDVVYLASDYLEGRETGTRGEQLAADYIANRFEELGLYPIGDNGTFFQEFPFREILDPNDDTKTKEGMGKNVLAYLDKGAETTVVIGGHYDHLGYGKNSLGTADNRAIHNGADDNASGIAAMLYLAKQLVEIESNNNYLFIAFSGVEKGLFGSKYYVSNPMMSLDRVNYMLNMDMVGHLNKQNTIIINGAGTSRAWKEAIWAIRSDDIRTNLSDSGVGASDHTSFYLLDIPVLHFFTGSHEANGKPIDDAHLINMEGIKTVSDYMLRLIAELDNKGRLDFIDTENKEASKRGSRYKVTLGVMPDYVFADGGMKIDGIIADRPAQKAGFKKGDIVVKVGSYTIKDIYAYMDVLNKFEPGDKVKIVVNRNGKLIKKKVQF